MILQPNSNVLILTRKDLSDISEKLIVIEEIKIYHFKNKIIDAIQKADIVIFEKKVLKSKY